MLRIYTHLVYWLRPARKSGLLSVIVAKSIEKYPILFMFNITLASCDPRDYRLLDFDILIKNMFSKILINNRFQLNRNRIDLDRLSQSSSHQFRSFNGKSVNITYYFPDQNQVQENWTIRYIWHTIQQMSIFFNKT